MERKRRSLKVIWNVAWALQLYLLPSLLFRECQGMRDIDGTARSAMGALQRDMKMLGDITICTGLKRYIACIEGSNLAITKAFWGRISDKVCPSDDGDPVTDCDGSEDTLPLVKGYCEGKRECKLEARHTLLQKNGTHHCPGVNKYLVVNYTCIPESKSVTLCDSAETTLMCEAGWVIDVADIFWGRRSHAKYCGAEEGMECDSSDSASKYIRTACDGHRRCPVRADPSLLDNSHSPCTTILKYLMINYVCKPPEKENTTKSSKIGLFEDEVKETSKLMQDPSSQDLTGLIQNTRYSAPRVEQAPIVKVQTPSVAQQPRKVYNSRGIKKSSMANDDLATLLDNTRRQIMPEYEKATSKLEELAKIQTPRYSQGIRKNEVNANEAFLKNEVVSDVHGTTKDLVPKSKDSLQYELTEPSTVRSILARAKEVLKTLDSDAADKSESFVEKREGIAHQNETEMDLETEKTIATVARLAKNLADTAATDVNPHKETATVNSTTKDTILKEKAAAFMKPKPGIKKSAIVPSGQGNAGVGNTP